MATACVAKEATERIDHRVGVGHGIVALGHRGEPLLGQRFVTPKESVKLLAGDEQTLDVAVVLSLDAQHLENLPALGLQLANQPGHVFPPGQRRHHRVDLHLHAKIPAQAHQPA